MRTVSRASNETISIFPSMIEKAPPEEKRLQAGTSWSWLTRGARVDSNLNVLVWKVGQRLRPRACPGHNSTPCVRRALPCEKQKYRKFGGGEELILQSRHGGRSSCFLRSCRNERLLCRRHLPLEKRVHIAGENPPRVRRLEALEDFASASSPRRRSLGQSRGGLSAMLPHRATPTSRGGLTPRASPSMSQEQPIT